MEAGWRALALPLLLVAALAGCTAKSPSVPAAHASAAWQRIDLPVSPGSSIDLRALGQCAGSWYAAGATVDERGNHPALWFSSDGRSFMPLKIRPRSVYGPLNALYSVACNGQRVVAIGAAVGGAHGNPRTSTWIAPIGAGATLAEVPAAFETYGGPDAVGVGPVTAGPRGFLIVGGRVDANHLVGAAVWYAPDGANFHLVDDDPALESTASEPTELHGAYDGPSGFVAVGGVANPATVGSERDAAAWTSQDGRSWQRASVPSRPGDDILERVIATPAGLIAAGLDGTGFAAWTADAAGGNWQRVGHFGDHGPVTSVPRIIDLAPAPGDHDVYAAVSTGAAAQLWVLTGAHAEAVNLPRGATDIAGLAGNGTMTLLATGAGALWATG